MCFLNLIIRRLWDNFSKAEGDGCVYLYPDIKVGLVGTWKDGEMVTARPAKLIGFSSISGMVK